MRINLFFLVFIGLISTSLVFAKVDERLPINSDNLTYLALNHLSPQTLQDFIIRLAKNKDIRAYYKAKKEEKSYQALLDSVKQEIQPKLNKIGKSALFKQGQVVTVVAINEKNGELKLSHPINSAVQTLQNSYAKIKGLPAFYFLLFANTEIKDRIKIKPDVLEEITKQSKTSKFTIYLEQTLKIVEFQNQQEFQVVIQKIDIYRDKSKKQLLGSVSEKRSSANIIKNWLLAGGYTNKLIGIHSFDVFAFRIQDMLADIEKHKNSCKKSKPIGKHLVLECVFPIKQNISLQVTYLGGLLARFSIFAQAGITQKQYQRVIQELRSSLNLKPQFFSNSLKNWKKYSVNFSFFPLDLTQKLTKKRLLFTMISDATLKLIERSNSTTKNTEKKP